MVLKFSVPNFSGLLRINSQKFQRITQKIPQSSGLQNNPSLAEMHMQGGQCLESRSKKGDKPKTLQCCECSKGYEKGEKFAINCHGVAKSRTESYQVIP